MKKVEYLDPKGRKYQRLVESDESEEMYQYGINVGPPEDITEGLGLSDELATRLHNQLYQRGLWTIKDINKNPKLVFAALQATLGINQQKIVNAYLKYDQEPED
jgi:hypothetical protein